MGVIFFENSENIEVFLLYCGEKLYQVRFLDKKVYGFFWVFMDMYMDISIDFDKMITRNLVKLLTEIDEFKGAWKLFSRLSPEKLTILKKIATIESIGSSTRIEGSRLSDEEIDVLLANLDTNSFRCRDEEEVAEYEPPVRSKIRKQVNCREKRRIDRIYRKSVALSCSLICAQ
jgi:hypothetical protein